VLLAGHVSTSTAINSRISFPGFLIVFRPFSSSTRASSPGIKRPGREAHRPLTVIKRCASGSTNTFKALLFFTLPINDYFSIQQKMYDDGNLNYFFSINVLAKAVRSITETAEKHKENTQITNI
jgi:hypothetical protein